jgi:DNA sulfur modification protein DndD
VAELAARTMQQNINSIELSILEKLTFLMGKENLINDLRIDPQNLQVLITTGDDVDLPVDRLSAGERQLLAIATLWGLATVSGHPLPLVIDTPLGRLDSEHRRKLVTNYFPNASEQVLILSTDEEIDTELHALLMDSISHQYILEYDDSNSSTSIRPGYFTEVKNGR